MKRFVTAIALTCVLSASAFAGDVPIVPAPTQTTSAVTTVVMTILSLLYR